MGLGPGHPHARRHPQPEPRREARHPHDGRHDLHRRHHRRLPRRLLHRQQSADDLGLARHLDDGRLRRRRLHRRLHEGAPAAQPRAHRLAQDRRARSSSPCRSAIVALSFPNAWDADTRVALHLGVPRRPGALVLRARADPRLAASTSRGSRSSASRGRTARTSPTGSTAWPPERASSSPARTASSCSGSSTRAARRRRSSPTRPRVLSHSRSVRPRDRLGGVRGRADRLPLVERTQGERVHGRRRLDGDRRRHRRDVDPLAHRTARSAHRRRLHHRTGLGHPAAALLQDHARASGSS